MSYLTVLKMPSASTSPYSCDKKFRIPKTCNIGTHLCQKFHFLDGGIKERCYAFISL